MADTTDVVVNLETLFADKPSPLGGGYPTQVHVWPVFFKVDGATVLLRADGRLCGPVTVSGTDGVGPVCTLVSDSSTVFPAEVGQWSDKMMPIPIDPTLGGGSTGGVFGVAIVLVQPGGLESDALLAGHKALNDSMQQALNGAVANLPPFPQNIPPDQINAVQAAVEGGMTTAIEGAVDGFWDSARLLFSKPVFGKTFALYSLDQLPTAAFDQRDLGPRSGIGPGGFSWSEGPSVGVGPVGVNGAISISRRNVGQGVLHQFPPPVVAVAGFASPDGIQHAIAATNDGELTEMWWQGPGQVSSGYLGNFDHQGIAGLAGYFGPDGYHHVIAATDDGTVYERYWQASDVGGADTLTKFSSPIRAIAGYPSADGFQHVIVATADGNITEVWWQTGAPGRGSLGHMVGTVVDLAGFEAGGVHHVFVATDDGNINELTWSRAASAIGSGFAQVEAQPWNHVLGVGAYDDGQESHVIVGMSNGTVREFQIPRTGGRLLHTDLAIIPGMVPIIDAYSEASGFQHVIAATADGAVHELWWNRSESQSSRTTVVGGLHTVGPPPN